MGVFKTAFPPPGGWSVWVRDSNDVRHFIVAVSKEADALGAVIAAMPYAQLLSSEPLTRDLVLSLNVRQGEVKERKEWAAVATAVAPASGADVRFRRRAD